MAARAHAKLSPSGADRWLIHCTPSANLEAQFPSSAGEAAAEGTAAHALCEHKLKRALKRRSHRPHSDFDSDEMEDCADGYVAFVLEQMQEIPNALVCIEQRLDLQEFVPEAFGTADCLIVGDGILHVIDFKYGLGVLVDAEQNPQMMLYALGALAMFGSLYDVAEVKMSIYQPRRENVSTWSISADELMVWTEETVRPRAQMAFKGEGAFTAGAWCQFCRASPRCRARAEAQLSVAQKEFRLPPVLTDEEIADLLPRLPEMVKWANAVSAYALQAAVNHGKKWQGYKLVSGRSVRKYVDEEKVAEAAQAAGFKDIFEHKLITLTSMEKLMGKAMFNEVLGGLIIKPQGKPTLVPESDKRPAIDVVSEFTNLEEKENG
ncbi:DUF2800 domain-containing protein [Selenomonas ruminantium]|uniref:DUF2800 domain-containing protein n=1 Tax=Selenomonas ruminantium TaxID=971 RepID=A0A1K1M5W5_SELRU|nr:DUF2800 domain-containing protein [Selenomonas ruminantium]SFW18491.1 Protein of unknown function [Selenomonas ruminantium]